MQRKLTAEGDIVEVRRRLDSLDLAANIVVLDLVAEVRNSGVGRVVSTEYLDSLLDLVRAVDIIDCRSMSTM